MDKNLDAINYRMRNVDEKGGYISDFIEHPVEKKQIVSGKEALIRGYVPSTICSFLWNREFLNKNNLRIYPKITHMDVEFTVRAFIFIERIIFVEDFAYFYVQRQGSITKPKTNEKLKAFLFDEVKVSSLIKKNIQTFSITDSDVILAIQKNYNTVIWNLLLRLILRPSETDYKFKLHCIKSLKEIEIYPIKGPLKTKFQKLTRPLFNLEFLMKLIFKL
jgi:hypothetical protein